MKTYLWWRLLWTDIVPRRVKILTNESEKERWFSQDTLYKQTSDPRLELDERKHFTRSKESNIKTNIKQPSDRWMTHTSVPVRWTPGFDTTMSDSCTTTANKLPKEQNVQREDQALDDGGTTTCSHLEEHLSYLWGFQYGQGVWHSCEGLIYLLDIDGVFLMCVRGWGTRLYEGSGGSRTEGWRVEKQTKDKKDGTANERQSSKGRAQEENAGLDRMQPAIAIMSMKEWRERRESDSMRRSVVMVTTRGNILVYNGILR